MTVTAMKSAPAPVPVTGPAAALAAAREAFAGLQARRAAISEQIATVEAGAAPAAAAAGAAQSLRQQKTGLIARMLKLGKVDTAAPDVVAIDRKLVDAEQTERQSAAVAAARAEVIADLEAQVRAFNEQLPAAHRELLAARFAVAEDEIRNELIPALRTACSALGIAIARLAGAGKAHCELARELREQHAVNVQALGTDWPQRQIVLNPIGFSISDNGNYNSLVIDVGPQIDAAEAEALRRWRG